MKYLFPFFVGIIAFNAHSQQSGFFSKTLQKDSLLKEFSLLYEIVNTYHPGQFMHCTKKDFDHCYDSLQKSIQSDISPAAYFIKISVLLAKIHDGHTWVDKPSLSLDKCLVFPYSLYKVGDKFIIRQGSSGEYPYLNGSTVLSINNQPMIEIEAAIRPMLSVEGKNETAYNDYYQLFPFYYLLIDSSHSFTFVVDDNHGNVSTASMDGIPYNTFMLNTRKIVEPVDTTFDKNGIATITLNTFAIDDFTYKKIDYVKYIDEFFRKLQQLKIDKLIIDVRGNGGGSAEISNHLFSWLTEKKYYYFEYMCRKYLKAGVLKKYSETAQYLDDVNRVSTVEINKLYCVVQTRKKDYWWFEEQKGRKECYKGELVTLIDGGSFSTTGHFAALLSYYKVGKMVGECTEGSYYSNDGGHMFRLPYSQARIRIPTAQFKMRMPGFKYDERGICPDKEVGKTSQDFNSLFDRQLEEAKKMLLEKQH